ncbi:Rv1355c family protein [Kibdelosporangium persicum]|uniref:Thiazole biosynthesis adenylyltransferase ThiF n=1 Tax=Kibdelosporangium persicum TaxID=2698649 RepID=A0ABX2FE35_9PSEU|nr:Rv1355c family protein [Kibdelosporangium persicum]NRN69638.1 Thiazole biosynthesis adenylyltransferase ThiF [Kibdelosporangium persicum]
MSAWRPEIFDPADAEDRRRLGELRSSGRVWETSDTLRAQLRDLAKSRCPGGNGDVDAILAGVPLAEYGRWVHYPWSGRLVRLLPPGPFRELRLDRNRPKVSHAEMARLAGFTVGIAGLSVGNAVALTLALEGAAGHLRLADFDTLELSNMNRIRAGVHDIGQAKTVLAARQIAEFDPYLGISVLDGIGPENVDEFLLGGPELGPPLDAVIDECDSLNVKFLLRHRARAHRRPVLMETSDRGMLDVERFDLEPDRPLFHGMTGDTADVGDGGFGVGDDAAKARKAAIALRLLDEAMISTNLAASFVEMGSTISSWPQLASDVVLGGASMTAAVRALALGAPMPSGRRYLDLETKVREVRPASPVQGSARPARRPLPGQATASPTPVPELARYLVEHAVLAPSGGNAQPWHFYWDDDRLWVAPDRVRGQNAMDPDGRAVNLALGAAVENIVIAAAARGLTAVVEPFPYPDVAAVITTEPGATPSDEAMAALLRRRTHRTPGTRSSLTLEEISELTAAASGARLDLCLRPDELAGIVGACDRIRFLNPDLHRELVGELRFTPAADGITLDTLALPPGFAEAIRLIARPDVAARLRHLGGGARLEEGARDAIAGASAMGLLSVRSDSPADWLAGGRAMQRIWLRAEQSGLGLHPMTTAIYMFGMLDGPAAEIFTATESAELHELRARFHEVMPKPDGPMALLFRLARITTPAAPSSRVPTDSVLTAGRPPF